MVIYIYIYFLGTLYFQRTNPYLIVPAIATFSCASGLYVFPAIELYFTPAMRLFSYEKANGVGSVTDLIFQGFIRFSTIAFIPVLMSTSVIYLLVCNIACMYKHGSRYFNTQIIPRGHSLHFDIRDKTPTNQEDTKLYAYTRFRPSTIKMTVSVRRNAMVTLSHKNMEEPKFSNWC